MTIKCGLLVRLEAKPGKEQAVADFLVGRARFLAEHLVQLWRDEVARQLRDEAAREGA